MSRSKGSRYKPGDVVGVRIIVQSEVVRSTSPFDHTPSVHYLVRCQCGREQWITRWRLEKYPDSVCPHCAVLKRRKAKLEAPCCPTCGQKVLASPGKQSS